MPHIQEIFDRNFLEYASYVIKDRAIPDIEDGLKPVQRRILYTLYKMDDGTHHKVAAVVGQTMFLHPHGDASIYEALVNLANKDIFINKQGNFGNIFTGDPPAAARYIECHLLPFAKKILFHNALTQFVPSYDSKMQEPVTLPAKIPLVLVLGTEGIAVGMSTKILPHNIAEIIQAMQCVLKGESVQLFPDFPTGGLLDCSQYQDGMGKVISRAKFDLSNPKSIVIRELPYGSTVESLIQSIEDAAKKGKIKIGSINDYTSERVEIEIDLPRGVYAKDVEDSLYAFTACESSISVNCLVIKDRKPCLMTISGLIHYHAQRLMDLLCQELTIEKNDLLAKIKVRTLERIFIEERIYKQIEELKTSPSIHKTVKDALKAFEGQEFLAPLTNEDIEHLLALPIRRISLFDIEKNKKELSDMQKRIKIIDKNLANINGYAYEYLNQLLQENEVMLPRKTELTSFKRIDIREAAIRNLKLRYNAETGYLGYELTQGQVIADVSQYDKVLIIRANTHYQVVDVPSKMFIDQVLHVMIIDKDVMDKTIYNVVYRSLDTQFAYIKRFKITQFLSNKIYDHILPSNTEVLAFSIGDDWNIVPHYQQGQLLKQEKINVTDYLIKGAQAMGTRIKARAVYDVKLVKK